MFFSVIKQSINTRPGSVIQKPFEWRSNRAMLFVAASIVLRFLHQLSIQVLLPLTNCLMLAVLVFFSFFNLLSKFNSMSLGSMFRHKHGQTELFCSISNSLHNIDSMFNRHKKIKIYLGKRSYQDK